MSKMLFSVVAVMSLVLSVVRFLPAVQENFPGLIFWWSPAEEVQEAIRVRAEQILKANAIHQGQLARMKQTEAERTQVRNLKRENLKEIAFLTAELQKCGHSDAVLIIHGVQIGRHEVEGDLSKRVTGGEELGRREALLTESIARLQETTTQSATDLAKARGEILTAQNWLNETKADLALWEVRRWSGSSEDPLVRIRDGENRLEKALREMERELAESGVGNTSQTDPVRSWERWSGGHATSGAEIQSRAKKLLEDASKPVDASHLTANPTQN